MNNVFEFKQKPRRVESSVALNVGSPQYIDAADTVGSVLYRAQAVLTALAGLSGSLGVGGGQRLRLMAQDLRFEIERMRNNLPEGMLLIEINDAYVQRERLTQAALAWCVGQLGEGGIALYKHELSKFVETHTLEIAQEDRRMDNDIVFHFECKDKI